jgi:TrmH family RNA methyltransferase
MSRLLNGLLTPIKISENPKTPAGERKGLMAHQITSAQNPLIKTLKSLHLKKGRAETGLFLAEGARLAIEAAELGAWPETLLFSPAALERPHVRRLIEDAEAQRVRTIETSEGVLAQISKRDNPQTVIGAYRQRLAPLDAIEGDLIVALDGVRDPGNLGTIVRTADSVGAGGVILVGESCDPFSVEAVRATMGSLFAVKLARATLPELVRFKQARGASLIGASLKGDPLAPEAPLPQRVIVFMGNEQSGLNTEMEAACDHLVRLPMRGRADSLNLGVATAVMLYDVWRRRGYDGARD